MIGGEWLTEINVTSPTGIVAIDAFNGTDTAGMIWDAIERKRARARAVTDWIIKLIEQSGYLGVAFLMVLETCFRRSRPKSSWASPGSTRRARHMTLWGVIVSGTAGAMLGNCFWYLLGARCGCRSFPAAWSINAGRWLTIDWREIDKAANGFSSRYGAVFVFFGRLLPTVRSLISLPAGLLSMPLLEVHHLDRQPARRSGTALLAIAGYQLGQQFDEVETFIGPLSTAVIVLIVVAYLWRLFTWRPAKHG